jgi:hypothetical protein
MEIIGKMDRNKAKLNAIRYIPIEQVVSRDLKRVKSVDTSKVSSVKATNLFISPKLDDFKKTIDDIRATQNTAQALQEKLRDMVETAYLASVEEIKNLKQLIDERTVQNKPLISLNKQLNRAIVHSAALYEALTPAYQAETLASSTKISEFLTEIVSKVNSV